MSRTVAVREVAHSRSGEKGNSCTISLCAYDMADYSLLRDQVTLGMVQRAYGPITKGAITRYEVPRIGALNFVLEEVLEGGRSRTLAFEESGKALSSLMLGLTIEVPDGHEGRSACHRREVGRVMDEASPWSAADGRRVRLGAGAGWARDRYEPALQLVLHGALDYLCFDSMSEVTMSAAQAARVQNADIPPYDPNLVQRLAPLLAECKKRGIRIITNQGWIDSRAAASEVLALARSLGLDGLRVAAVDGSIFTDRLAQLGDTAFLENGQLVRDSLDRVVSAEAYLGASGIAQALAGGADVVITTRIADACLYLGPLVHEFGWQWSDVDAMGRGMVIGHLMECAGHITGGNFADPGYKTVEGLARLGNPIAEVSATRQVITKLPQDGGLVDEATCKEQLLYEVHDPASYYAPDCIADFSRVAFRQLGKDVVEVLTEPGVGRAATPTLKALVGLREGFMTEEMVIFAGPGALDRAKLTQALLEERFRMIALQAEELRFDYLGINAVHREASPQDRPAPYEVILRIGLRTASREEGQKLRREVDPLAGNGAYGTGKWATNAEGSRLRTIIGLNSCLIPRSFIAQRVHFLSMEPAPAR